MCLSNPKIELRLLLQKNYLPSAAAQDIFILGVMSPSPHGKAGQGNHRPGLLALQPNNYREKDQVDLLVKCFVGVFPSLL